MMSWTLLGILITLFISCIIHGNINYLIMETTSKLVNNEIDSPSSEISSLSNSHETTVKFSSSPLV